MLSMTELIYFSPTGGTKKAGEILCEGISGNVKAVNLGEKNVPEDIADGGLVVAAVPVFGGRIPSVAAEKLKKLNGDGKKAVTLVVYGNRAYEDALLELNDIMEERKFQVIASAAVVAQHSMAREVAKGRPDEQDRKEILAFAEKVVEKLEKGAIDPVKVPGNHPYKEGMGMPAAPITLPSCKKCGKCVSVCPTDAIQMENDAVAANVEKCILCMSCVAACPEHARILPPPLQQKMEQMLGALKSVRRENEWFL